MVSHNIISPSSPRRPAQEVGWPLRCVGVKWPCVELWAPPLPSGPQAQVFCPLPWDQGVIQVVT